MSHGPPRALSEADWELLRTVRLHALRDSPDSFVSSHEEEAQGDEQFWRDRLQRAQWFVTERDGEPVGVVGLGDHDHDHDPGSGEVFGLWVRPDSRRGRVARDLVKAAVERAAADDRGRLYFWVDSNNGPAVAFASVVGFRPTAERRRVRAAATGAEVEEIAMVLILGPDPTSVVNPQLP